MRLSKSIPIALLLALSLLHWGCSREYSYEGGGKDLPADTTLATDTVLLPPPQNIISCLLCNEADSLATGSWRFHNNASLFCGTTTDAGFIGESTFTFFGPSACSNDSGMVITVYLPVPFNQDQYSVTSNRVAFYYYDHHSNTDLFIKLPPLPFSVTVDSYIQLTGIAMGTFAGTVYQPNGDTTSISNGRFKVRLK